MTQQTPPPPVTTESAPKGLGAGASGIGGAVTKKLGPLPVWGWAIVIGGAGLMWRLTHKSQTVVQQVPIGTGNLPTDPGTATNDLSVQQTRIEQLLNSITDALKNLPTKGDKGDKGDPGGPPGPWIDPGWGPCGPMPLYASPPGTTRTCIPGVGWKDLPLPISTKPPAPTTYTVVKGDNLSKIAARFGTTWQALYSRNKALIGGNPNLIRPGQRLTL